MNTLIIGNGFDKAHGLPTNYLDFLDFIKAYRETKIISWEGDNSPRFVALTDKRVGLLGSSGASLWDEFGKCISNNIWVSYFESRRNQIGSTWMDFESEIQHAIKIIAGSHRDNQEELSDPVGIFEIDKYCGIKNIIMYSQLFECLYNELKTFNRALEIYMDCVVSKYDVTELIPQIKEIKFDRLLSFNYTSTYTEHYDAGVQYIDYIHGQADSRHLTEECNLVLGFDDHYFDDSKTIAEIIPFEKYYQRIVNGTGYKYLNWKLNPIKVIQDTAFISGEDEEKIYFYGHSLSPMDGDVIKYFIQRKRTHTYIFYLDEKDRANKIRNLAVILNPTELIKLTTGPDKTIDFIKIQQ